MDDRGWDVKSPFLGKVRDEDDTRSALGAMAGVSHGITSLIPSWLTGRGCSCTQKYELAGRGSCGDAECFALRAGDASEHVTLYIDTNTSALRRYATRHKIVPRPMTEEQIARAPEGFREHLRNRKLDPFIVESEILYTPAFDAPLAEADFAFDPTASSSPDRPGR